MSISTKLVASNMTQIPRFIFVLGMHRSGTSCLAGALETCGLYFGDVLRMGRYNAKGYFESLSVMKLHNQILRANGASWLTPPETAHISPFHQQAIQDIVYQFKGHYPCGIKDPRLLFLLKGWLDVVEPPYAFVGTFRHPEAVGRSLAHRNGLSPDATYELWLKYNQKLVELHQQDPFPLVEYRLDNAGVYCSVVADVAEQMGLKPNLPALQKFVEAKLEHYPVSDRPIPPVCQDVYKYLLKRRHRSPSVVRSAQALDVRYPATKKTIPSLRHLYVYLREYVPQLHGSTAWRTLATQGKKEVDKLFKISKSMLNQSKDKT